MPDPSEDRILLRVAEAISDGRTVDWELEESSPQELRGRLKHLKVLEAVAAAHVTASGREGSGHVPGLPTPSIAMAAGTHGADARQLERWGHLTIRERVGQGGFGDVYRAYDPTLQREVALKILHPGDGRRDPATARFLDEARRLARVRHPNVVVVHGVDEREGLAGIWTDLVRGSTLEHTLASQGPLGADEASLIGIDLCGALAAVHAAGLVHRDIKTANVMREHGGRIVLMDFGSVSDQVREDGSAVPETITGTPLFMAPELLAGETATPSSDIYSMGVVLYRLVSGRFPVEAASLAELLEKHRKGERFPLRDRRPDLPPEFVQVVERALSPEAKVRYPSAGAMEQALTGTLGLLVPKTVIDGDDQKGVHRRRVIAASVAAAAVLALGAYFLPSVLRPGPFSAEASLFRITEGREERLMEGSLVRPGDRLVLEISAREEFNAYVLSEDENGEVFVMFPAGLDQKNPLPPDTRERLPGTKNGIPITWEITSVGGTENMLVIASRSRQPDLEAAIVGLPKAEAGRQVEYAPLGQQTLSALRGIGGLAEEGGPAGAARGEVLAGIARNLGSRVEGRDDFWMWQIRLQNPGR